MIEPQYPVDNSKITEKRVQMNMSPLNVVEPVKNIAEDILPNQDKLTL